MITETQYDRLINAIDILIKHGAHVDGSPYENVLDAIADLVEEYEDANIPPLIPNEQAETEAFNRFLKSL